MPRNGSGVYSLPAGYQATTGTTATAASQNDPLEDIQADLNAARPISAGGTGGRTVEEAQTALGLDTMATQADDAVDINGGTIDGVTIGATTPAAITVTTFTATGVASFSDGTAAAPAIAPASDTDTGFHFPAAGAVNVSFGGSDAIFLRSGGIGYGRAPTEELDLYKASGDSVGLVESASLANDEQARVSVRGTAGGATRGGSIGVLKHTGISAPCMYLNLQTNSGFDQFHWTDDFGNLRISGTATHIGTTSGTVVGTQTSDERLKDVAPEFPYGLAEIMQVEPILFSRKDDPNAVMHLGFGAQQVQPIIPEVVFDTGTDMGEGEPTKLGMDYSAMIPALVKAVQEQQAMIDDLRSQVAEIRASQR